MNVKQGGSRQSLSQADQKLLKTKDPEQVYISSQGCLERPQLPTPTAQPRAGQPPLWPLGFDSILPQAKLEEHPVHPEGVGTGILGDLLGPEGG